MPLSWPSNPIFRTGKNLKWYLNYCKMYFFGIYKFFFYLKWYLNYCVIIQNGTWTIMSLLKICRYQKIFFTIVQLPFWVFILLEHWLFEIFKKSWGRFVQIQIPYLFENFIQTGKFGFGDSKSKSKSTCPNEHIQTGPNCASIFLAT